jgi:hypothetical protein
MPSESRELLDILFFKKEERGRKRKSCRSRKERVRKNGLYEQRRKKEKNRRKRKRKAHSKYLLSQKGNSRKASLQEKIQCRHPVVMRER